jgi:hypothetical protein
VHLLDREAVNFYKYLHKDLMAAVFAAQDLQLCVPLYTGKCMHLAQCVSLQVQYEELCAATVGRNAGDPCNTVNRHFHTPVQIE